MTYGAPDSIFVGTAKRVGSYIDKKEGGRSGRIDANAIWLESVVYAVDAKVQKLADEWGGLAGWKRIFRALKRKKR